MLATASGAEKHAFCRELGADVVIDRRSEDIAARVREETGGRGADVIFDTRAAPPSKPPPMRSPTRAACC